MTVIERGWYWEHRDLRNPFERPMADAATTLILERLRAMAARKQRFSYDVRGNSYVTTDLIAAYNVPLGKDGLPELEKVLEHAFDNDAIVSGHRNEDGKVIYSSCRIFTDARNALNFAKAQGQTSVYNWNRWAEVLVEDAEVSNAQLKQLPA